MEQDIYFHIPKCGGSTLNAIVKREYRNQRYVKIHSGFTFEDFLNLDQSERDEIKLLGGVLKFGIHKFLASDTRYFGIIRDPVNRIISLYNYIHHDKAEGVYKKIPYAHRKDLHTFVEHLEDYPMHPLQGHDGISRLLSGREVGDPYWDENLVNMDNHRFSLAELAIKNVNEHFAFLGTVERFNESLILMKKVLGWKNPLYFIKRNITQKKETNISPDTVKLIEKKNKNDLILYDFVKNNLEKKIDEDLDFVNKEMRKMAFNTRSYAFYRRYLRPVLKR